MKNHVPDPRTCARLRDAGFPQNTNFGWVKTAVIGRGFTDANWKITDSRFEMAAPILTEILEQLPDGTAIIKFVILGDTEYLVADQAEVATLESDPNSKVLERITENPTNSAALLWLELNTQ